LVSERLEGSPLIVVQLRHPIPPHAEGSSRQAKYGIAFVGFDDAAFLR
jgi:hypothetical protein